MNEMIDIGIVWGKLLEYCDSFIIFLHFLKKNIYNFLMRQ